MLAQVPLCVTSGMGNVARRTGRGSTRSKKPRLTRAQRRDHLLDAAAELVGLKGVGAVTMEGVAARAGVSKALPYTHFDDATDLLMIDFDADNDADFTIALAGVATVTYNAGDSTFTFTLDA